MDLGGAPPKSKVFPPSADMLASLSVYIMCRSCALYVNEYTQCGHIHICTHMYTYTFLRLVNKGEVAENLTQST